MTKLFELYQCEICGNLVSIVEEGKGDLVCCGQKMVLLGEKTIEYEGKEKHVPVLGVEGDKVIVRVGSVEHPMEKEHYIELIQLVRDENVILERYLKPGDKPWAVFCVGDTKGLKAKVLCNMHGLWIN